MELQTTQHAGVLVVSVLEPRIDASCAIGFKDAMRAATADGPSVVLLNLSAVEFIDSSGLGAIVASMKSLGRSRQMALAGLNPTVDKVFRLTRMDAVFKLFPTMEDAEIAFDMNAGTKAG